LIETEKLARMIHIALGSGYEPERETLYHCDIVINNPRQKMDIFGTDEKGKEHWLIRKGKFVV
jgi:leucyl aminopeptidase (aminopeptidase T)